MLRSRLPHILVFTASGAGYFLFRALAFSQGDQGTARVLTHVAGDQGAGLLTTLWLLFKALGFYAKKLIIPFPLNFGITHVSDGYIILGIVVAVVICWLLVRRSFPDLFFVSAAAVASSALLIPLLRVTWTPLAERYLYIPSAFFLVGVALTLHDVRFLAERRRSTTLVIGAIGFIALYGTASRNLIWQDNLALYRDTLRKSPDFVPARNELANALYARGDTRSAMTLYKSFDESQELLNVQYGMMNKALALTREGDFAAARRVLRQALSNPGKHETAILRQLLEVNRLEVEKNKILPSAVYPDTVELLSRLSRLTGDPFYHYRLGVVHLQAGHRNEALGEFTIVARTAPADAYYRKPAEKLAATLAAEPETNRGGEGRKR